MAIVTTPFGNGTLVGSGGNVTSNVHSFMGPRTTGGTVGVIKTEGMREELVINLDQTVINGLSDPLIDTYLPAGSSIVDVYLDMETAFDLTGTNPTILIGTNGSEVTNGFVISETLAEGTATTRLTGTLTGTWSVNTPLAARTRIGIAIGGTGGPAVTSTVLGKGRVTIFYIRPNLAN